MWQPERPVSATPGFKPTRWQQRGFGCNLERIWLWIPTVTIIDKSYPTPTCAGAAMWKEVMMGETGHLEWKRGLHFLHFKPPAPQCASSDLCQLFHKCISNSKIGSGKLADGGKRIQCVPSSNLPAVSLLPIPPFSLVLFLPRRKFYSFSLVLFLPNLNAVPPSLSFYLPQQAFLAGAFKAHYSGYCQSALYISSAAVTASRTYDCATSQYLHNFYKLYQLVA